MGPTKGLTGFGCSVAWLCEAADARLPVLPIWRVAS